MVEIEFSTIHNGDQDVQAIRHVLDDFERQSGVRVHLNKMLRAAAWNQLMNVATTGKGPDVSHVGSTWVSSMVSMNAIRPFNPNEVARFGNESTFIPSAWQDTHIIGDSQVWAAPWNSFLYVIFYRRDFLARAGVDEATAFNSVDAIQDTIAKLQTSGLESPWLIPYQSPPYEGLLHMAASWVWGAGGAFVNEAGNRVTLDSENALSGLSGWLDSQRAVPETSRNFYDADCIEMLVEGRSAAIVSNIRTANELIQRVAGSPLSGQIGFATTTNTPWCAGDSLVVWQHTRAYPNRQRAALDLVNYLMSAEAQAKLSNEAQLMPTRRDALQQTYPPGHPLHAVASHTIQGGRAYASIRLWRRIEYQLAETTGALLQDALANANEPSSALVRKHIGPVVQRLNLILGN